ncbi:MAG: DEAD/DEAH box helicase [Deltaproteobacteria bacterium]|nr:DEAD/DEAH box helicase [Deltaproteobacteria bacterium]
MPSLWNRLRAPSALPAVHCPPQRPRDGAAKGKRDGQAQETGRGRGCGRQHPQGGAGRHDRSHPGGRPDRHPRDQEPDRFHCAGRQDRSHPHLSPGERAGPPAFPRRSRPEREEPRPQGARLRRAGGPDRGPGPLGRALLGFPRPHQARLRRHPRCDQASREGDHRRSPQGVRGPGARQGVRCPGVLSPGRPRLSRAGAARPPTDEPAGASQEPGLGQVDHPLRDPAQQGRRGLPGARLARRRVRGSKLARASCDCSRLPTPSASPPPSSSFPSPLRALGACVDRCRSRAPSSRGPGHPPQSPGTCHPSASSPPASRPPQASAGTDLRNPWLLPLEGDLADDSRGVWPATRLERLETGQAARRETGYIAPGTPGIGPGLGTSTLDGNVTHLTTFDSLGLSASSLAALARAGYERPTPIQQKAIPPALAGRDLVGCAATGTGKTAAFLLPIIERLDGKKGTRALVLAPTRELATQIAEHLEMFGRSRNVRGAVVIGGVGMQPQVRELREGHEVIVATPGRLVDHLERGTARLTGIEILVLDEADRMLDMGFKPQLEKILAKLPKQRQTMLFSATMAGEVASFTARHLRSPEKVEIARSGTIPERAEQRVFLLPQQEKAALLLALLAESKDSTLIFTRTRRRADRLYQVIARAGHEVARIHADRSQGQRRMALDGFKDGKYRILVATDIAARGIDVEEIGHVVNFDLPHVPEDYVHRVGRTARAAASGRASSFCSPDERDQLRDIEKFTRLPITVAEVPRESAVFREVVARRVDAPPPGRTYRRQGGSAHRHQKSPGSGGGARSGSTQRSSSQRPAQRASQGKTAETSSGPPRRVGSWKPRRPR